MSRLLIILTIGLLAAGCQEKEQAVETESNLTVYKGHHFQKDAFTIEEMENIVNGKKNPGLSVEELQEIDGTYYVSEDQVKRLLEEVEMDGAQPRNQYLASCPQPTCNPIACYLCSCNVTIKERVCVGNNHTGFSVTPNHKPGDSLNNISIIGGCSYPGGGTLYEITYTLAGGNGTRSHQYFSTLNGQYQGPTVTCTPNW